MKLEHAISELNVQLTRAEKWLRECDYILPTGVCAHDRELRWARRSGEFFLLVGPAKADMSLFRKLLAEGGAEALLWAAPVVPLLVEALEANHEGLQSTLFKRSTDLYSYLDKKGAPR